MALLKNAPLLVLDEPTAGLDPGTERELLDAVYRSRGDRATLVITHRLVRMEEMDEILVLDRGRIVERGTQGSKVNGACTAGCSTYSASFSWLCRGL